MSLCHCSCPKRQFGVVGRMNFGIRCVFYMIELIVQLIIFALFASAYPDRYRTTLWLTGGIHGWNSDPALRIYFYANHQEPPEIPWIWTQRSTEANLAIATAALSICLARGVLMILDQEMPIVEIFYDILCGMMWSLCISTQLSADRSDPEHPSSSPWNLRKSCTAAVDEGTVACIISQICFVLSILILILHVFRAIFRVARLIYLFKEARQRPGADKVIYYRLRPAKPPICEFIISDESGEYWS